MCGRFPHIDFFFFSLCVVLCSLLCFSFTPSFTDAHTPPVQPPHNHCCHSLFTHSLQSLFTLPSSSTLPTTTFVHNPHTKTPTSFFTSSFVFVPSNIALFSQPRHKINQPTCQPAPLPHPIKRSIFQLISRPSPDLFLACTPRPFFVHFPHADVTPTISRYSCELISSKDHGSQHGSPVRDAWRPQIKHTG